MWSNFRTPQPTNHTLYVIFKKELRQAEIGIWKENPHGNTMVKYMKAILRPLKPYSVAVWVFFPDTNLHLPRFLLNTT